MYKKCHICGMVKKITFNCTRCNERICLNCYNFILDQCFDCVAIVYGQKYSIKIKNYANEGRGIEVITEI